MNGLEVRTLVNAAAAAAVKKVLNREEDFDGREAEPTSLKEGNVPCTNTASDPMHSPSAEFTSQRREGAAPGEAKNPAVHWIGGGWVKLGPSKK